MLRVVVLSALALSSSGGCGGPQQTPSGPQIDVSAELVRSDVDLTRRALREAYAGRERFHTPETWASMEGSLDTIQASPPDTVAGFCDALSAALSRLATPSVHVTLPSGERCRPTVSGAVPYEPPDLGVNVAAETPHGATVLRDEAADVTVVGIARFEAPEGAPWGGLLDTLSTPREEGAILVDLRNAVGTDPRSALALFERLTGQESSRVLRSVTVSEGPLAARMRAAIWWTERDPEAWRALVGSPRPPTPSRGPAMTVLVGGACQAACELAARLLVTYAGATLHGGVGSSGRLAFDAPAVLELASGIVVRFPLAAYELDAVVAGIFPGAWHEARVRGGPDALGEALGALRQRLAARARQRRWADEDPPPCASFPELDRYAALPEAARARFSWEPIDRHGWEVSIVATLSLEPERARAYVEGCPELEVLSADPTGEDGRSTMLRLAPAALPALSRLAQCEALEHLTVQIIPPPQLLGPT